jgi:signal peptidase II
MTGGVAVPDPSLPAGDAASAGADEVKAAVRPSARALVVLGLVPVLVIGLDLLTKQLALTYLSDREPLRLLGGALYLTLTRNSGAAFSIGGSFTMLFPLVALVVVTAIILLARRLRSVPWAISLGLIVGGALGNVVDRVFRAPGVLRGHVVDMVSLFDPYGQVWPIFNAADSALFCGVVLAVILEFSGRRRDGTRHSDTVRHSDREPV